MAKIAIHRTRIGKDIVAEFVVPPSRKHQKLGRVVVLCQGAPAMPGKSALLDFLATKGFYAVLPRYRGTWESSGTFLKDDPTNDIREVIDALAAPLLSLYEGKEYRFPKKPKIYLFASSFGGPASFFLSTDSRVTKVIALSPVCDWAAPSKAESLETMDVFTKQVYGEGYRIATNGYKKLATGKFYNPMTAPAHIDAAKVVVFHAKDDAVVSIESVERYAMVTGLALKIAKHGGHFGLSEVMNPETWHEVTKILKKKAFKA
jgi:pimeloyl-ACP methyl ester carboxylesterase